MAWEIQAKESKRGQTELLSSGAKSVILWKVPRELCYSILKFCSAQLSRTSGAAGKKEDEIGQLDVTSRRFVVNPSLSLLFLFGTVDVPAEGDLHRGQATGSSGDRTFLVLFANICVVLFVRNYSLD
ncbi:putative FERM domain-containing protein FRMD8P1 [Manis javanica]|nr:putative FERM domain-containing protein FRMD8P1 [Manis javanica]